MVLLNQLCSSGSPIFKIPKKKCVVMSSLIYLKWYIILHCYTTRNNECSSNQPIEKEMIQISLTVPVSTGSTASTPRHFCPELDNPRFFSMSLMTYFFSTANVSEVPWLQTSSMPCFPLIWVLVFLHLKPFQRRRPPNDVKLVKKMINILLSLKAVIDGADSLRYINLHR